MKTAQKKAGRTFKDEGGHFMLRLFRDPALYLEVTSSEVLGGPHLELRQLLHFSIQLHFGPLTSHNLWNPISKRFLD